MSISAIKFDSVSVKIKKKKKKIVRDTILENISFNLTKGNCLALLGPSGAGKTTILRAIAGFIQPSQGEIKLFNRCVNNVLPEERGVSMLFQDPVLFPHLSVRKNATVGFKNKELLRDYVMDKMVADFEIRENIDQKICDGLSGGEKQRAALLRTFVNSQDILLLDEPLKSALNIELRWKLMRSIKKLLRENDRTSIIVTHDFDEAAFLADEIGVLSKFGKKFWIGLKEEMYYNPPSYEVATVLGKGVEFNAEIFLNREKREVNYPFSFESNEPPLISGVHSVFIRPTKILIDPSGSGFKIKSISFQGEYSLIELCPKNELIKLDAPIYASSDSLHYSDDNIGQEVGAKLASNSLIYFNQYGERILV